MVERKKPSRKSSVKKAAVPKARAKAALPVSIKRKDIGMLEDDALRKAQRTLQAIDRFMSGWDALKAKPAVMRPEIIRLQRCREELGRWHAEASKAQARKESDGMKALRLREFIMICNNL